MTVLGEAVDEGYDAGGAGERGAPLLEAEVGRDDRRTLFVSPADDVVEDVGGARINMASILARRGGGRRGWCIGEACARTRASFLAEKVSERSGEGREPYGEASGERGLREVLRDHRLAEAGAPFEQDVLTAVDELELDETLDERPIDLLGATIRGMRSVSGAGD